MKYLFGKSLFGGIVGICLVAAGGMTSPVQAAFSSDAKVEEYPKEEVKKGVQALRTMPSTLRQACFAEKLGLLFMATQASAYKDELSSNSEEGCSFYGVRDNAQFVTSNGKVMNFLKELQDSFNKKNTGKSNREMWTRAKRAIGAVGEEVVFAAFAADITKIAQQTAKTQLKSLPSKLRDAWLAHWGNFLFMEDGSNPYSGETRSRRHGTVGFQRELVTKNRRFGAKYIDSQGNKQDAAEVWQAFTKTPRNAWAYDTASWCVCVVGAEDILAMFPKETKAMAQYYAAARAESGAENAAPAQADVPDTPAVRHMRELPMTARQAVLAEMLELLYMPDGGSTRDSWRGWTKHGAKFLGGDGVEYDFWKEHDKVPSVKWQEVVPVIQAEKKDTLYAAFATEVADMKHAAAARKRGK